MRRPPLYVLPGPHPGLLYRGNIDINNRPPIKNPKGGISTVYSASFGTEVDGRSVEVLVPLAQDGRIMSVPQAEQRFFRTKQHLGIFDTPAHATQYGNRLHIQQAKLGGMKP
jgi:hypothetical protein